MTTKILLDWLETEIMDSYRESRWNKLSSLSWDYKLCELLTEGEFDPDNPYKNLAIPAKDLVRYWWKNIADREAVLQGVLEDVLTVYKDRMLPKEEEESVDVSDAFDIVNVLI